MSLRLEARRAWLVGLVAVSAAAATGLVAAFALDWDGAKRPFTLTASTGYVMAAVAAGAFASPYGRFVLAALGCCWLGDMVGPGSFLLGAYAFLAAHLLFIPAFMKLGFAWRAAAWSAVPTGLASAAALAVLLPAVPAAERPSILAYTLVISAMLAASFGVIHRCRLVPLAATIFYVSDLFVARWRYLGGDWNSLICYPLYYASCLLFACTIYTVLRSNAVATSLHDSPNRADAPGP